MQETLLFFITISTIWVVTFTITTFLIHPREDFLRNHMIFYIMIILISGVMTILFYDVQNLKIEKFNKINVG